MPFSASNLHRAVKAQRTRNEGELSALFGRGLVPAGCGFAPFVQHGQTVQAPALTLVNQQEEHPAEELNAWWSVHEAPTTTRWVFLAGEPESWFLLVVSVSAQGSLELQVPIAFRLPADRQILEAIATAGALGFAVERVEFDGHAHSTPILWVEPVVSGLRTQLKLPQIAGVRLRKRAWARSSAKEVI